MKTVWFRFVYRWRVCVCICYWRTTSIKHKNNQCIYITARQGNEIRSNIKSTHTHTNLTNAKRKFTTVGLKSYCCCVVEFWSRKWRPFNCWRAVRPSTSVHHPPPVMLFLTIVCVFSLVDSIWYQFSLRVQYMYLRTGY